MENGESNGLSRIVRYSGEILLFTANRIGWFNAQKRSKNEGLVASKEVDVFISNTPDRRF